MCRSWSYVAALALVLVVVAAGCSVSAETAVPPYNAATGSAPPQDWQWPTRSAVSAYGVQFTSLGVLMKATSAGDKSATDLTPAPSLDYIVAFVAISADPASGRISVDPAGLKVVDSLGGAYPANYDELVTADGLTVAAVRFRGSPTGVRTYSLGVERVRVGSGAATAVAGSWRLDLIQQAHETLRQGTVTGGPSQEMPVEIGGRKVMWALGGSGPEGEDVSIGVQGSAGSPASIRLRVEPADGAIQVLGETR